MLYINLKYRYVAVIWLYNGCITNLERGLRK